MRAVNASSFEKILPNAQFIRVRGGPIAINTHLKNSRSFTLDDIKAAEDLLTQQSGESRRKYSDELAAQHSRTVAGLVRYFLRMITASDSKLNFGMIAALLHDVPEDFKGTYQQIIDLFNRRGKGGNEVAESVKRMTTPRACVLVHKYPEIAEEYLPNFRNEPFTANTLRGLASEHPDTYYALKSKLKLKYKLDAARGYSIYEVITKILDSADYLNSMVNDIMANVSLDVHESDRLGPPAPWKKGGPRVILTTAEANTQVQNRLLIHAAHMERLAVLSDHLIGVAPKRVKASRYHHLVEMIDRYFKDSINDFKLTVASHAYNPKEQQLFYSHALHPHILPRFSTFARSTANLVPR